jgi:hypothetical protein
MSMKHAVTAQIRITTLERLDHQRRPGIGSAIRIKPPAARTSQVASSPATPASLVTEIRS